MADATAHDRFNALAHMRAVLKSAERIGAKTALVDVRLLSVVVDLAAARESGYAQARAEDIAALRAEDASNRANLTDSKGRFDWESYDGWADQAADYLASLTPTQEVPDGR